MAFEHLAVGPARACRNQDRRQPGVIAQGFAGWFADVFVGPDRLAVVPPLALFLAQGILAPDDLAVHDEDQRWGTDVQRHMAISVVRIGRCFHRGQRWRDLLQESRGFRRHAASHCRFQYGRLATAMQKAALWRPSALRQDSPLRPF